MAMLATCAGADLSAFQGKLAKTQNRGLTYSLVSASLNCGGGTNRQASVGNVHRHASADVHRHRAQLYAQHHPRAA